MIRYLTLQEVQDLHRWALQAFGGTDGVRDIGLVESAVAAPQMTFAGADLYPTVLEKAAALGFSLAKNHGFVDGNKRVAFWSTDVFLRLNAQRIACDVDEGERAMLQLAGGAMTREQLAEWLATHIVASDAQS